METLIGIGIWLIIFVVWYARTYPDKFQGIVPRFNLGLRRPRKARVVPPAPSYGGSSNYKGLVEAIESTCALDKFQASDAASMVEAVKQLMDVEPASGQIWEAYALDSLESAEIVCDECRIPVDKTVKKTGVKIHCRKCGKWLALKNSKVTILDPSRADLEDWER